LFRGSLGVTAGGEYFGSKIITPTIAESVLGTVAGAYFQSSPSESWSWILPPTVPGSWAAA